MIKITNQNQIAVLSLPIEVKDRITKIIKILEESYDRTTYHDEGGFVVVLENIADLKKLEEYHLYLESVIPEYVEVIKNKDKQTYVETLILLNSDFSIVLIMTKEMLELTPWKNQINNN